MSTPILHSTLPPNPSSSTKPQFYDLLFVLVAFMILGIAGVVCNVFILLIIKKNKSLQSPCFLLICLECVCSIILSIGHLVLGVNKAIQLDPARIPIRPRWLCYTSTVMLATFAVQAHNISVCCVALDRLISLISPTRYQIAGGGYVRGCWAFCLIYTTGTTIWGLVSEPSGFNAPTECTVLVAFLLLTPSFLAYRGPFNLAIGVLAVILYILMLITFKLRVRAITDLRAAQAFLKHQQACMPTVKLLMIFYTITAILPDFYMSIATFIPGMASYIPRISCYVGPVKATAAMAQIIALYFGSTKFRQCAKAALGYGQSSNAVGPAGANSGRHGQNMTRRAGQTQ